MRTRDIKVGVEYAVEWRDMRIRATVIGHTREGGVRIVVNGMGQVVPARHVLCPWEDHVQREQAERRLAEALDRGKANEISRRLQLLGIESLVQGHPYARSRAAVVLDTETAERALERLERLTEREEKT